MKANYGFMDGSGQFYITIDTDKCIECSDHPCVAACPVGMFQVIEDDWDDEVAEIKAANRKTIKYDCAPCKPIGESVKLPCMIACTPNALEHSW